MKTQPIYRKLWYIYLLCIIFPLIVLATILTTNTSYRIMEDTNKMNFNMLSSISTNIETMVTEMTRCSIQWVNNTQITDFYKKVSGNHGSIPADSIGVRADYVISARNILFYSNSMIVGMGFYPLDNPNQIYYNATHYDELNACYDYNLETRPWFETVKSLRGSALLTVPGEESCYAGSDQRVFSIVRLAYDVDTKVNYGIVKVDTSVEYFEELFSSLVFGENSGVVIVSMDGDIIFSTSSELDSFISVSDDNIVSTNSKYTLCEESIGNTSWRIVLLTARADLFREIWVIILTTILTGLATLLFSLLLFLLASKKLTAPMNAIVAAMHSAQAGNLKSRISLSPGMSTEFYIISTEYNRMLDKIDRLVDSEYKAKINQQRAEFAVLQAQINPHFLYNALNNFIALNRMGYRQELEDSIISLTELFRYSSGKGHERTVAEEMKFIEHYLQLQHVRYRDRLEYSIFLDQSVGNYLIPKLILQPVVENSIVHGTEPIDRCVHISICAVAEEAEGREWLKFTVSDDGAGVDMEAWAAKINRTGLRNIQSRLEMLSKDSVFRFDSSPNNGATTIIKIPFDCLEIESI